MTLLLSGCTGAPVCDDLGEAALLLSSSGGELRLRALEGLEVLDDVRTTSLASDGTRVEVDVVNRTPDPIESDLGPADQMRLPPDSYVIYSRAGPCVPGADCISVGPGSVLLEPDAPVPVQVDVYPLPEGTRGISSVEERLLTDQPEDQVNLVLTTCSSGG